MRYGITSIITPKIGFWIRRTRSVARPERRQAASLRNVLGTARTLMSAGTGVEYLCSRGSPTFLLLTGNLRQGCSVCPTKGGTSTGATICGVLLLDPSLHSPLELVKSMDDVLDS